LAAAAFVVKLVALVVQVQVLLVLMVSLGVLAQRVLAALAIQAEVAAALVDILRSAAMAQMELLAAAAAAAALGYLAELLVAVAHRLPGVQVAPAVLTAPTGPLAAAAAYTVGLGAAQVEALVLRALSVSSTPVQRARSHRPIRGTYKCPVIPAYGRSPSSFKVAVRDCGLRYPVRLRLAQQRFQVRPRLCRSRPQLVQARLR
jgi:hypothetical protein